MTAYLGRTVVHVRLPNYDWLLHAAALTRSYQSAGLASADDRSARRRYFQLQRRLMYMPGDIEVTDINGRPIDLSPYFVRLVLGETWIVFGIRPDEAQTAYDLLGVPLNAPLRHMVDGHNYLVCPWLPEAIAKARVLRVDGASGPREIPETVEYLEGLFATFGLL